MIVGEIDMSNEYNFNISLSVLNHLGRNLCFIGPPLDPVFREKYGFDADKAWQAVLVLLNLFVFGLLCK